MRSLGIDEAGRGCVLGPLVVGAFWVDDVTDEVIRGAGATDSKKLSAKRRDLARTKLDVVGSWAIEAISCAAIDGGNLNHLEEEAIAALVAAARPDVVYIDALGHPKTIPATVERLEQRLGCKVHMQPKADLHIPVVGAASIFAKTERDAALHRADATHGPLGSGYPSDPVTRTWLRSWAERGQPWPDFVRTRWQTVADLSQGTLLAK